MAHSNTSKTTVTIALDAMGGDKGPDAVIPGAARALSCNPQIRFLIFGDKNMCEAALYRYGHLRKASEVRHCDHIIRGDDKPSAALRKSKGTSMRSAIEAVQSGEADAIVSAGNTGALMALSKVVLKTLPGIHRPAIASLFPGIRGSTIMLDLGANVLVDAENLVQFAVLGAVFARAHKNIQNPSVGLLNVGSEDMKGPDHVRGAAALLAEVDFPGHYKGFVEGNDITAGEVDVVVSDGYAGNIALKAVEGVGKLVNVSFKNAIKTDPLAYIASVLGYFAFKRFRKEVDPRLYNGGVFLGLNGLCIKSHGGADALAFSSAVNLAASLAQSRYLDKVTSDISHLMSQDSFLAQGTFQE